MRCVATRRALVIGLACALLFLDAGARALSAQGDARERTLFVTAVDAMDNPVDGLTADDVIVREDGVRREVLRISRATEPLDVALLVDNAEASAELVPRVREGINAFVAALMPQHSVALVALADRPTILVDYTTRPEAILAGTRRLFTMERSGATLLDALVEVSDGLRRRETARIAIVPIVTDGIEYSNRRHRDVIDAVVRSGASLYPITVGRFLVNTTGDAAYERGLVLSQAPDATGGQRITLLAGTAIEESMARVARYLTSQYKVVYSRPETLIPPEKVEVSAAKPQLTVHGTPARVPGGNPR